jgi:hypothetical protein
LDYISLARKQASLTDNSVQDSPALQRSAETRVAVDEFKVKFEVTSASRSMETDPRN